MEAEKKKDFIDWILVIISIIFPVLASFWALGIIVEIIKSGGNPSMLLTWGQVSLTIFGFCLIGGIFEKNKTSHTPIMKHLFYLSMIFLAAGIGFFTVYSMLFLPNLSIKVWNDIMNYTGGILWALSIVVFVFGVWLLFIELVKHLKEL